MRSIFLAVFVALSSMASAKSNQGLTQSNPQSVLNLSQQVQQQTRAILNTKPSVPAIPAGTPDRFNEGLFTAKEQVHDQQITDLSGRVSFLEGRSNFLSGAVWAIGILTVIVLGFLKLFWKGIAKVILTEIGSPIVTSS